MRLATRITTVTSLVALAAGVAYVIHVDWRAARFPYPLDYGEGPLLEQALRLGQGRTIYHVPGAEPPWTVANYPPGYPLLDAGLAQLFGPAYAYGRVLSTVSAAGAAVLAGLLTASLTRDRLAAWVTGLLVPTIPCVGFWSGLARVDCLALVLSLAGLWLVVRWPRRTGSLAGAVLLLAAAACTRQTSLVAAPLTAVVWLLAVNRRRAALFAGSLAAVVLLTGLVLAASVPGFWFDVVTANVNELDLGLLAYYGVDLLTHLPVLVAAALACVLVAVRARPTAARVVVTYLLAAAAVSLTAAKVGSGVNYLLELGVALSLAVGALLAWLRQLPRVRTWALGALSAQVLGLLLFPSMLYRLELDRMDDTAGTAQLARVVQQASGPVLADEEMGLLPLAGKTIELQPFELTQLVYAGRWDQGPLLDAIQRRRYAAILVWVIPDFPLERQRWTSEMLDAIDEAYVVDERIGRAYGETLVYRPRR